MKRFCLLCAAIILILTGCSDNSMLGNLDDKAPRTVISVIVDTSGSWLGTFDDDVPLEEMLETVGLGLNDAVASTIQPVEIRYYAITRASFGEHTRCIVTYTSSLRAEKEERRIDKDGNLIPPRVITKPAFLKRYLSKDCPDILISQIDRRNDGTDIEGALYLAQSQMMGNADAQKLIIVVSDLIEASRASKPDWQKAGVNNIPLLMVMRPASEDAMHPARFQDRQQHWMEKTSSWGFCPFSRIESTPTWQSMSVWIRHGLGLNAVANQCGDKFQERNEL